MEIFPGTSGHRGGVVCDDSGRALDVGGEWIEGLYACGSTAAGLSSVSRDRPETRRRRKRREEIYDSAIAIFNQKGYAASSIE